MKVRLNMYDAFSGCTHSIDKEVNDTQLAKLETLQMNQVPVNQFKNSINYSWIIEEIEMLSS